MKARLDSGAEDNFLRLSTVTDLNLNRSKLNRQTTIEFASGETTTSNEAAHLNSVLEAIVLPDRSLVEDLISVCPLVDLGYDVLLTRGGGSIIKDGQEAMAIAREGNKWTVEINKLQCLAVSVSSKKIDEIHDLHRRLGHASPKMMIEAIKNKAWTTTIRPEDITSTFRNKPCSACILAKKNRISFDLSATTDPKSLDIGQLISGDIVGPIHPPNRDGHKYFFLFVDRRTSLYHAYTSATKDAFITALKRVYDYYTEHRHKVRAFRSDSEKIMIEGDVEDFLVSANVQQQTSAPYRHEQNLVERHVQTVTKAVATLMVDQALLDATFWSHALFYCIEVKNNTPNSKTGGLTPLQMVTGTEPLDLRRRFLFPFGTPVAVGLPKEKRTWKFDVRNEMGVYLGENPGTVNAGIIYYPSTNATLVRSDLIRLNIEPQEFHKYTHARDGKMIESLKIELPDNLRDDDQEIIKEPEPRPRAIDATKSTTTKDIMITKEFLKNMMKGMITRKMSKMAAMMTKVVIGKVAQEIMDKLNGPEGEQWKEALQVEIKSILEKTKSLAPEEPKGVKGKDYDVIAATVLFKKKMLDAETLDKYKARIPLCGNQLTNKPDYVNETYSPTVSPLVHNTMLQLIIHDKMYSATMDTIAAYLYQHYPQELKPLYVKFPKYLAEACGLIPQTLYRVLKYMYGLPDAGRAYYEAYSTHLIENGYTRSASDICLFYKLEPNINLRTYIWIHVDDTFIASTHEDEIDKFKAIVESKFEITINYDVTSHLGINLTHYEDGRVKLTQPKLLAQILSEYDSSTSLYPATPNVSTDNSVELPSSTPYLRLLGQLSYMTNSRPDIMTAVAYAATKSNKPTEQDYKKLLKIVAYLRQTPNDGTTLYPKSGSDDDKIHLKAYVDAAYMSHDDASSHTGFTVAIGSRNPKSYFYSKSVKQKLVATSSTHAEIRALYDLTVQLIFLAHLCQEIGRPIELPIEVHEDNQPAIDLVSQTNGKIGRSKHFLMTTRFIKEQVETGLLKLIKEPTNTNISNVLTKVVVGKEFYDSYNTIMGTINHNK